MKANLKSLVAGIALVGAMSAPALAGGDYYSVKDAGVPVPAPIPVPLYDPVWYFRLDTSLGLGNTPGASESGLIFGNRDNGYVSRTRFGSEAFNTDTDYEQSFMFGFGVGYRWNSWLRMDVTGETKLEQSVRIKGMHRERDLWDISAPPAVPVVGTYNARMNDDTILRGGVVLFNGYYDFEGYGAFRPYIGAGLGFAVTEISRTNRTHEWVNDGGNITQIYGPTEVTTTHHAVTLAAAASVGATYQLSDITDLDFSYRYLWMDGYTSSINVNGDNSTLSFDDVHDHQLRAGLRFNVN